MKQRLLKFGIKMSNLNKLSEGLEISSLSEFAFTREEKCQICDKNMGIQQKTVRKEIMFILTSLIYVVSMVIYQILVDNLK